MTEPLPAGACFTCDVNSGREPPPGGTIYEDERWIADHGVSRLVRGYLVLKPKRHVHELADLEPGEAASLGPALGTVLGAMRAALQPDRIYVCSFAETVHHLHFHLLPRYADMPALGPNLMSALFSEDRFQCTEAEALSAASAIRSRLGSRESG